jgi:transcriptional regulator with PAS, ATPase and Fis domain
LFTLDIPPLRERKEDIPLLVTHILRKINYKLHKNVNKIPIEIMDLLKQYSWPGNVRELENVLLQAVVLSSNDAISKENIKFQINEVNRCDDTGITLEELEKRHILKVLKSVNWNKNKATTILGISKPTLYSKVEKYKLTKNLK